MAKYKRTVIGSVLKSKTAGEPDYIKIRADLKSNLVLKPGTNVRLESASFQLKSVQAAMKDGKLSEDLGKQIEERIGKIPDFVRFELVLLEKNETNG